MSTNQTNFPNIKTALENLACAVFFGEFLNFTKERKNEMYE